MKVACFTSASYNYMDRVRVLFETVREFHPEWKTCLCLVDQEPVNFQLYWDTENIDQVVKAVDLAIPEFASWAFEHDIIELCTAVKGQMLCELLEQGFDKVVYLDPDTALFGRLDEVIDLLDHHSSVLTPHQVTPDTVRSAIIDNEMGSLKYGIFNLGFVAVSNAEEGRRFARWWRDRLIEFCFDEIDRGLFTDQKWCNHAPVFFPDLAILRHRGYNVASWNISQRAIHIDNDGSITAGGESLKFFHFTKVTHVGEVMLARYAGDHSDIFELLQWYKSKLTGHAVNGLPERWWHYSNYDNGKEISPADRLAHRSARLKGHHLANPFASSQPISELLV